MTAAQVSAAFSEELHPRAPKGSGNGGQFSSGGSGSTSQTTKSRRPAPHSESKRPHRRRTIPHGQLGFDGQTGTGYGLLHGDPRVKALQQELNRLGLLDMHGRKLVIDGKLGPLTTSSIRAAQRRLGMRATGIIAPAFIDRLRATKTLPPAKPRAKRKRVHAKFDPSQARDPHSGEWIGTSAVGGALKDALNLAGRIELDPHPNEEERLAGSGRLNLDSSTGVDVVWAVVDSAYGREYRIGTVNGEDVPKWRAAELGATASLTPESANRLVDDLAAAQSKADDLAIEAEDAWDTGEAPTDPVLLGESPVAEGSVDSAWGPVDWSVYLDDSEPVSYTTSFKVGTIGNLDAVQLDADGLTKLIDGLDAVVSAPAPVQAAASEPYGDVSYADPGYQPDGKKRYPLDTEAHCRNAWSRINAAKNAAKYTADQLAKIKARILAAGRKYGIEFADDSQKVAAATLRDVELARTGDWKLSSGPLKVTQQMLQDAARYAQRRGGRAAHVKIGHVDPRFDGEPALGWLDNVRYAEDERGPVVLADVNDMPDWLAAAARSAWPYRSIEGWADFTDPDTGEKYGLVIEALALLGVTPPGMPSLKSLRDLPKAVGIAAASGVRVVASMASAPPAVEEGAGPMDPAKIREALGLPAGASDDEVRAAGRVAFQIPDGEPGPAAPVQASLFGDDPAPAPVQPSKPAPIPDGMMLVSASVWQQREDTIKTLTDYRDQSRRNERDDYIAKAVAAGKFTPAQRPDFVAMWDGNPEATRTYIDKLMPNTALAVMASGYAGSVEIDDVEREYQALTAGLPKWGA